MIPVYRPDNPVDLALVESLLTDAGIPYYVQNKNFSSLYPGAAIDLFSACAVMVPDEAETVAFGILSDLIATQEENAKAGGKASSLSVSSIDRELDQAPLGKHSAYIEHYDASLLFPIPRAGKRTEIGIATDAPLPFFGNDVWNAYELSWLEPDGKPRVALASFTLPATSPNIIESKSLKLYLNSFNQSIFASEDAMREAVQRDLSQAAGAEVAVVIISSTAFGDQQMGHFEGFCLDDLAIDTDIYTPSPEFLKVDANADAVNETLVSHLLKSNCLVTGQPDWGSVQITYTGRPIDRAGLLKYIISLRRHNEFHEQCVERMFMNVMVHCAPERLSVYARYTRRGGLDINPFRASHADMPLPKNRRLARQ